MEQKYITIGSLKITIQAFVLFVSGVVTAAIMLIVMPSIWFVSIGILVLSFVAAYVINCTVEGKCVIYSWTITVIVVLYFCFLIFLTIKERMGIRKPYVMNVQVQKSQAAVQTNSQAPAPSPQSQSATNTRSANVRQNATRA